MVEERWPRRNYSTEPRNLAAIYWASTRYKPDAKHRGHKGNRK